VFNKSVFLFVVLALSSFAFAQQRSRAHSVAGVQPASETCAFTFASGGKHTLTQFCVTANGNIAQLSAAAGVDGTQQEFLNFVAPATEGYGLCDLTVQPLVPYWDYASIDSNNWNPATAVSTPTSVTITRTTADGIWKLVQTITEMKASNKDFGAARISMALTNLSPTDRHLIVNRHAYIQGFFNDYDLSELSAFGGPPFGNGNHLASTAAFVTRAFDFSVRFVMTTPGGPTPCQSFQNQGAQTQFFQGDGAVEQVFNLDILPGKTKTVTVTYKPF
jgi:hypothetical protein